MPIKIVNNKKLDMTVDEIAIFEKICKSYDDPPAVRGKDLFSDLFETDENGIIMFLIPPTRQTTMEAMLFIQNIMLTQHLRINHEMVVKAVKEGKEAISAAVKRMDEAIAKLPKAAE